MKAPENLKPEEFREWYSTLYSTPLEMGIRDHWEDWQKAATEIVPDVKWDIFFAACFVPLVDVYGVVMCIRDEESYILADDSWVRDVLEAALLKVMGIPFYVELTTTEGGRDMAYWREFRQNQMKKLQRLHLNTSTEIFALPRTSSTPPA
jgi:hypothetical protein